jgi:phage virion morphogenesis protein
MVAISVSVDDRQVLEALNRLRGAVSDMSPAFRRIGAAIKDNVRLGFSASQDPWGGAWAGLSAVTLFRRRKGKGQGSPQPLLDTGRLRNSITFQADATSAVVGTGTVYAAVQQFGVAKGAFGRTKRGASIPWGNIPARPFLPIRNGKADLPESWKTEVLNILQTHLKRAAS